MYKFIESIDGTKRLHVSDSDGGYISPSQVAQEQDSSDYLYWRRSLIEPEDPFERSERLDREFERKYGDGPTSLAAAEAWIAAWRAS